jgi:urease accessory protein
VIGCSTAVVAVGGVLREVRSEPPLAIRQVRSETADVCALCVVGSAAGPLAGDEVRFDLTVQAAARAHLSWTGAALAQGRTGGAGASVRTSVRLAPDAVLVAEAQPVISCAGSRLDIRLDLELAPSASLRWRELVVLGRAGEPAGAVRLDWDVRRGDRPLLRQRTDLTASSLWPGLLRGRRVLATELRVGPEVDAVTVVRSDLAVAQRVDEGCVLVTVLADDAASALSELAAL